MTLHRNAKNQLTLLQSWQSPQPCLQCAKVVSGKWETKATAQSYDWPVRGCRTETRRACEEGTWAESGHTNILTAIVIEHVQKSNQSSWSWIANYLLALGLKFCDVIYFELKSNCRNFQCITWNRYVQLLCLLLHITPPIFSLNHLPTFVLLSFQSSNKCLVVDLLLLSDVDPIVEDPACHLVARLLIHGDSFLWTSWVVQSSHFNGFLQYWHILHRVSHVGGSDDFNVVFVGAGNIMFGMLLVYYSDNIFNLILSLFTGSDEGPWNHSFRFEQYASMTHLACQSDVSSFLKQTRSTPQGCSAHRSSHRPCNSCSPKEVWFICYICLSRYSRLQNLRGFREEYGPEG